MRLPLVAIAMGGAMLLGLCAAPAGRSAEGEPRGLGDPGQLVSVVIESSPGAAGPLVLAGRDSAQQLIVTGEYAGGQRRDLTGTVKYNASPAGIVSVDASG